MAKVLISPLSWGYGHAGRMIPLALELQGRGCEVIFAADAALLRMAVKDLPGVTLAEIPGLKISYSRFLPQYLCIFLQLPRIIVSAIRDHGTLRRLAEEIKPTCDYFRQQVWLLPQGDLLCICHPPGADTLPRRAAVPGAAGGTDSPQYN
ncbi:MAG: hypothetical protein R2758_04020 [Bacteroidales bacterium]